ncbi:MAG TPA: short-chain dehydrogenase [Clostridiales bacterium]|nr:short-chain dehydrogenase [Clostridiales bacterium]
MKTIAIMTGASSGIGYKLFSTMPARYKFDEIWVIARSKDKLEKLSSTKGKVVPIPLDLSDNRSIGVLIDKLKEENPVVKLLVNCSGYGKFGKTEDIPLDETLGMIDLNCRALTAITHIALPYMKKGSEIMEIASVAGFQAIPYINVYAATKAYVLSFARALKSEVKKRGIKVTAVCPYWTKTKFFDRAEDGEKGKTVKKYFAVYDPEKVAKRAWKDLEKGKTVSSYGAFNKFLVFCAKILPEGIKTGVWKKSQGLE